MKRAFPSGPSEKVQTVSVICHCRYHKRLKYLACNTSLLAALVIKPSALRWDDINCSYLAA